MVFAKIVLLVAIALAIVLGLAFRFRDRWRSLQARRAASRQQRESWEAELARDLEE